MPRRALWTLRIGMLAAIAVVAITHGESLEAAVRLISDAEAAWLGAAAVAIAGVYLLRAAVYGIPLALLRYTVTRGFLWAIALVSTSLHQLVPTGGASGYVFLVWALTRRGVAAGRASLIALLDTLSNAVAVATLLVAAAAYLALTGRLELETVGGALAPGAVIVALASYAYHLQRDRRRCTAVVLRLAARLGFASSGSRWSDDTIRAFLDQYFEAKTVMAARHTAFARMVALQYLAFACDATALYLAFRALGLGPAAWLVAVALVAAMAGGALIALPGGGGSFELIMSAVFAVHGLAPAHAIAAAMLYRLVAFWAPVAVSTLILLRLGPARQRPRVTTAAP